MEWIAAFADFSGCLGAFAHIRRYIALPIGKGRGVSRFGKSSDVAPQEFNIEALVAGNARAMEVQAARSASNG